MGKDVPRVGWIQRYVHDIPVKFLEKTVVFGGEIGHRGGTLPRDAKSGQQILDRPTERGPSITDGKLVTHYPGIHAPGLSSTWQS